MEKILVVGEKEQIEGILPGIFSSNTFDVIFTESGEEALAIIQKDKFNVILLGLELSSFVNNGAALCTEIKRISPTAKIYAVTVNEFVSPYGRIFKFTPDSFLDAGFIDFFDRPVTNGQILEKVSTR